jgi:hypothetical protein
MDYRWIVDFKFRIADERQRSVIDDLGLLAHDVVRTWLRVILPDSHVFEQQGQPISRVVFPTRAAARRFIATWGGRLCAEVNTTAEA